MFTVTMMIIAIGLVYFFVIGLLQR